MIFLGCGSFGHPWNQPLSKHAPRVIPAQIGRGVSKKNCEVCNFGSRVELRSARRCANLAASPVLILAESRFENCKLFVNRDLNCIIRDWHEACISWFSTCEFGSGLLACADGNESLCGLNSVD